MDTEEVNPTTRNIMVRKPAVGMLDLPRETPIATDLNGKAPHGLGKMKTDQATTRSTLLEMTLWK